MVVLYARIFYDYQLYSDALLQVYFFLIQFYGLYYWLKGRADDGTWYSGDPEVRDWFFTKLGVLLSELKLPFQEVDGGDWLSRKSLAKEQIDVFLRRYQ